MTDVVGAAAGFNYSLALKSDGTVWAWGLNAVYGVLGDGTFNTYPLGTIVQAKGLTNVVKIDAGMRHSLAVKSDGSVWAWGLDREMQLGDALTDNLNIPARVIGLDNVIAIAGGLNHTMALKSDGTVWTCGRNLEGELGKGNFESTISFVNQVSNLTNVIAIAAGGTHNLALKADGTVWAWGANSYGQLGNGNNEDSSIPAKVIGLADVVSIASGGHQSLAMVRSTSALTPVMTSTQEASSGGFSAYGWWLWLILGLVVIIVLGIVWRIRHKDIS
jgi:alpha-tubulin suppressor-like RCC1 family protein